MVKRVGDKVGNSANTRELSHHESHVLALIHKWQPATAYLVRKTLPKSIASSFSDSPGSVYPVIDRLKNRGFVTVRSPQGGKKNAELLSCTQAGVEHLKAWIRTSRQEEALPEDPWRTRSLFSRILDPEDRKAWLLDLRAVAEQQRSSIIERTEFADEPSEIDALEHALLTTEARIVWVDRLLARMVHADAKTLPDDD